MRVPSTSKATGPNPKDVLGSARPAMLYLPAIARVHATDAMMDGAGKYDPYNWRAKKITAMNYLHAAARHLDAWIEGEECAKDSGAHHLGHAIASISILLDAQAHGCLIDDRPTGDGGRALAAAIEQVKANEAMRKAKREQALKELVHTTAVDLKIIECRKKKCERGCTKKGKSK